MRLSELEAMVETVRDRSGGELGQTSPAPARGGKPRTYSWALSKDVSVELRIVGDPLTKAEADRLRQYVDLTVSALVVEGS